MGLNFDGPAFDIGLSGAWRRVVETSRALERRVRSSTWAAHPQATGNSLTLWFGVVGFICIFATSVATASVLSNFMRRTWIAQDEFVMRDFVQSAVVAHGAEPLFKEADGSRVSPELSELFEIIASKDPVFLAHFYSAEGRIIWSSDPVFIGKSFAANQELDAALSGRTVTETGVLHERQKPEHELVDAAQTLFVETYIPILNAASEPIGVVELYRSPRHLQEAIDSSTSLIWGSTIVSGLALYVTLGWIVRWGDRRLSDSARELAESQGLAAIGEVATAVAHGLRNPMAAMRSSAELALDRPSGENADAALRDVLIQIDRLDQWIRSLIGCLRIEMLSMETCDAAALMRDAEAGARARIERADLSHELRLSDGPLPIHANRTAMLQILDCLIANALEATPRGGVLTLICRSDDEQRRAVFEVRDSGPGPDGRIDPFALFLTTKGSGLGVGLPIARRLVTRHGGALFLESAPGGGGVARLEVPLLTSQNDD